MERPDKYILVDGKPVPEPDLLKWSRSFEDAAARTVARDHLPNGVEVSTVFLGLDHNFHEEGPPILWETLIFGGEMDGHMLRYASEADARIGHAKCVNEAAEGVGVEPRAEEEAERENSD